MKRSLAILAFTVLLTTWGCNDHDHTKTENSGEHDEMTHQEADHSKELTLNNGSKWVSDSSTNYHASQLNRITEEHQEISSPTLEDHKATAKKLEAEIGQLVSSCTMKGPDHDALHLWLEPLLEKVKSYNAVQDLQLANQQFADIDKQIAAYNTYFN